MLCCAVLDSIGARERERPRPVAETVADDAGGSTPCLHSRAVARSQARLGVTRSSQSVSQSVSHRGQQLASDSLLPSFLPSPSLGCRAKQICSSSSSQYHLSSEHLRAGFPSWELEPSRCSTLWQKRESATGPVLKRVYILRWPPTSSLH